MSTLRILGLAVLLAACGGNAGDATGDGGPGDGGSIGAHWRRERAGGGDGALRTFSGALVRVARNPLIWAVLAGGGLSAIGLPLPRIVDEFLRLLGGAAGGVLERRVSGGR